MAQAEQSKGLFANKNKGKRFTFEGRNLSTDQIVRGEVVAKDEEEARKKLQRRGIRPLRVSKVKSTRKKRITQEDITVFTRQLATMMKAGLPLMQAFEIVARGHSNPSMTQMLMQVRADVEQGSALGKSFSKYPNISTVFTAIWCLPVKRAAYWKDSWINRRSIRKKPKQLKRKLKQQRKIRLTI